MPVNVLVLVLLYCSFFTFADPLQEPAAQFQHAQQLLQQQKDHQAVLWLTQSHQQYYLPASLQLAKYYLQQHDYLKAESVLTYYLQHKVEDDLLQLLALTQLFTHPKQALLTLQQQYKKNKYSTLWINALNRSHTVCKRHFSIVLTSYAALLTWQQLLEQWQQDTKASALDLCWQEIITLPEATNCANYQQPIDCIQTQLSQQQYHPDSHNIVVITALKKSAYRHGIIYLNTQATLTVFLHELFHLLGFIDEYELPAHLTLCQQESDINKVMNVVIQHSERPPPQEDPYLQQYLHTMGINQFNWTIAKTCRNTSFTAYKLSKQLTQFEVLNASIPQHYWQLAYYKLKKLSSDLPTYHFAFVNPEFPETSKKWLSFSSQKGYTLAQYWYGRQLIEQGKITLGFKIVTKAAQKNLLKAQIFLGHHFLLGNFLPFSLQRSQHWYQQAAQLGSSEAQYFLSLAFEYCISEPRCIKKQQYWFNQALLRKNPRALAIKN